MELQIGNRIRELRRGRNLTQTEVAAHLGISFQAISKWERGDGYPDITLLPAPAAYFEVSVDDLLGTNAIATRERYDRINDAWERGNSSGAHAENVALMKDALKEYPNNALLLAQLAVSLEQIDGSDAEKRMNLRQSAAVQEQILRYGRDTAIHAAVQHSICFTYWKLSERDKAIEQARTLPNLCKARENVLIQFLQNEERRQTARSALASLR